MRAIPLMSEGFERLSSMMVMMTFWIGVVAPSGVMCARSWVR